MFKNITGYRQTKKLEETSYHINHILYIYVYIFNFKLILPAYERLTRSDG